MDERLRFVLAMEAEEEPMAALCRRFGVSRRCGYKWLERYRSEGVAGLGDRSRAPLTHPQAVSAEVVERCLSVRRAHPTWGPVKVRAFLERGARSGDEIVLGTSSGDVWWSARIPEGLEDLLAVAQRVRGKYEELFSINNMTEYEAFVIANREDSPALTQAAPAALSGSASGRGRCHLTR